MGKAPEQEDGNIKTIIKNTEDMNQSNMRQIFMKEKAQLIIKIYSGVANHEHQQQPVTG